ncbi:MAG: rplY [Patescibacteria group bacterium]|nr:rplY [Patescibacteria group bacterium]
MEKIELAAAKRTVLGKKAKRLRAEGKVPAVVYGKGLKSEPVELESKVIEKVFHLAGGNKIVNLQIGEGRARNVLISDVQRDSLKGGLTHVDLFVVRMDEELKAEVPLHFVGESIAVFQEEGTLLKNVEAVEVECLPGDLPEFLEVDITVLDDFEKTITLGDLKIPAGVKLVTNEELDTLVARVEPPRSDAEMEELDEAVDEANELPEGVKEEKPVVVSEENEGTKDRRDKK